MMKWRRGDKNILTYPESLIDEVMEKNEMRFRARGTSAFGMQGEERSRNVTPITGETERGDMVARYLGHKFAQDFMRCDKWFNYRPVPGGRSVC